MDIVVIEIHIIQPLQLMKGNILLIQYIVLHITHMGDMATEILPIKFIGGHSQALLTLEDMVIMDIIIQVIIMEDMEIDILMVILKLLIFHVAEVLIQEQFIVITNFSLIFL